MTTITITHEGKTYTAEDERGFGHTCAGCAFLAGPVECDLPSAHPGWDKCVQQSIIWIEQQESPLDMPGFKAQKAYNGCEGCAFNECGTNCTAHGVAAKTDCHHTKVIWLRDGCCGQPNTCEQPCFHQSGRTTPGNPGVIAGVPQSLAEVHSSDGWTTWGGSVMPVTGKISPAPQYDPRDVSFNPLDKQVGGNHYRDMAIQPVQFIVANGIPYREANVIKYVCRHASKNGKQDLLKARHYIDMLIADYEDAE